MAEEIAKVTVDTAEVLAMLEAFGPAAQPHVFEASRITATRVQQEARSRARRATGVLQNAITVEELPPGLGFEVFVDEMSDERGPRSDEFALWHEAGTVKMKPQAFMGPAAQLEEGSHLRLISDALDAANDEVSA